MGRRTVLELDAPDGRRTIRVADEMAGKPLSEVLLREGVPLNTRCGRRRLCQGCVVELAGGTLRHADTGETVSFDGAVLEVRGCEYGVGLGDSA
ncbi:MAG: hypothetical protein ACYTGQ_16215, partial [Planctomycetota bacterium]